MVFFGEARWDEAAPEPRPRSDRRRSRGHGRTPARVAVDDAGAAGRAGRRRRSSAGSSTCPSPAVTTCDSWLEPVVEGGERTLGATRRGPQVAPAGASPRVVAVARRHRRLPGLRAHAGSRPSSRRSWPTAGTTTRRSRAFMGGPGREASRRRPTFDAKVIDGAVERHRHAAPRPGAAAAPGPERLRAQLRARHRRRRRRCCSAWFVAPEGCRDSMAPASRSSPRSSLLPGRRRASCVALLPRSRSELVQPGRPWPSRSPTLALSVWLLVSFETGDAGFQFASFHTWIEQWGISWHLGVDGISLFLVVLTGVLFPLALLGADPHHDEKPYMAWMLLLEAGLHGLVPHASTCSCSSSSSRSCSCRCTSSSAAGATPTGSTRRVKFFLFTMVGSAFMLVGILATVVPRPRSRTAWPAHLRPGRRSPERPLRRRPRRAGCSSPSPSRSR